MKPMTAIRFNLGAALRLAAWPIALLALLPPDTAIAQPTGLVVVSSEKDNALTLVDARTLAVVGTVPTCRRPRHLQFTPDRKRLLVACGDSGQADQIDLASRRSVGRVAIGPDPEIFDLSPDGRTLWVSNEEDGELNAFDWPGGRKLRTVKVGLEPEGVKVSPDGSRVYVSSEVASLVHVVSAADGRILQNIAVGKRPRRFAFNADGSELWVSNELGASVSIIDTRSLKVVHTLPFEIRGMRPDDISPVDMVRSPDGRTMYVGLGRANHVAFVDIASRRVRETVLAGKRAWGLGLNRDGSRLHVANGLSDDLTIIDTGSARALRSVPVGRVPHSVVVDD